MKQRPWLNLVLVSFLGLVILVSLLAYLAPSDTLYAASRAQERRIGSSWLQWNQASPAGINRVEKAVTRKVLLHCEVDNQFVASLTLIRAPLPKEDNESIDLFSAPFKLSSRAPPAL